MSTTQDSGINDRGRDKIKMLHGEVFPQLPTESDEKEDSASLLALYFEMIAPSWKKNRMSIVPTSY